MPLKIRTRLSHICRHTFPLQGSFLWNGDTDLDLMEDPELVSLFENLPDTDMSLAEAMQFTDSSLGDAAARSPFIDLPEETQDGLGNILDIPAAGGAVAGGEGFAQVRGGRNLGGGRAGFLLGRGECAYYVCLGRLLIQFHPEKWWHPESRDVTCSALRASGSEQDLGLAILAPQKELDAQWMRPHQRSCK